MNSISKNQMKCIRMLAVEHSVYNAHHILCTILSRGRCRGHARFVVIGGHEFPIRSSDYMLRRPDPYTGRYVYCR